MANDGNTAEVVIAMGAAAMVQHDCMRTAIPSSGINPIRDCGEPPFVRSLDTFRC